MAHDSHAEKRGSHAEMRGRAKKTFERWRHEAMDDYQKNPLLGAGLAVGLGFVLGGGLATGTAMRVMRRSVGLALQIAVVPALLSRLRDAIVDEVSDARLGR